MFEARRRVAESWGVLEGTVAAPNEARCIFNGAEWMEASEANE